MIQFVREILTIAGCKIGGATQSLASAAHFIVKIPHRKFFTDIVGGVEFTAGIKRLTSFGNDLSCQRNIRGDDQIASGNKFDNTTIGNVHPSRNQESRDESRLRNGQDRIGDERDNNLPTYGGTKKQLFRVAGASVSIDPNLHSFSTLAAKHDGIQSPPIYRSSPFDHI